MTSRISTISELRADNCKKTGSYSLVTVIKNPIINAGETITIDQYISGYGTGSGVKIVYYPSLEIFDVTKSKVSFGPKIIEGQPFTWGGIEGTPDENGITLTMGPMYKTNTGKLETFCDADVNSNNNAIATEQKVGNKPPFHYELKTQKNAKPGTYKISFVFTYFNGEDWHSSGETVEFKIHSFFERHSTSLSIAAFLALLTTIVGDGIIPLFNWTFGNLTSATLESICTQMAIPVLRCT